MADTHETLLNGATARLLKARGLDGRRRSREYQLLLLGLGVLHSQLWPGDTRKEK